MDYMLTIRYQNGSENEIGCATRTDVENFLIDALRVNLDDIDTRIISFEVKKT